jgi:DNA/RNA endonuclease G (NUC1)
VIHHLYAAGLNEYNRRADWVAYRLSKEAVGVASLLTREWQPDRLANFSEVAELADLEPDIDLPDIRSVVSPYGGGGEPLTNEQNRVRLAPMTGYANTPYWSELNNTSNMLPMPAPLRMGPWLRLEQNLNALVAREEELHVIAGPLYFDNGSANSDSLVPGINLAGYYKIVVGNSGIASFVFPQDLRQHEPFCQQINSLE